MVRAVRSNDVLSYVTLLELVSTLSKHSAEPSNDGGIGDGIVKDLQELVRYIRRHPVSGLSIASIHDKVPTANIRGYIAQGQDGVYVTPRGYEFLEKNRGAAGRNL